MQNSDHQLPPEQDYIANLIVRFKVAYKVLTARQSITIVDNELNIFNMNKMDAFVISSQIASDMSELIYEEFKQVHEEIRQKQAIDRLVYCN